MTLNFVISTLPRGPIPADVLEETKRWHAGALDAAIAAADVEEIERLSHMPIEAFARAGMLADAQKR